MGSSKRMLDIFGILDRISTSAAPVLISGESGTGKELIANAVHQNSPRKGKVFVSENCGALTETLLESELFGYVKGAFTGAHKDHKGLFELATSGTLFLDEVGDMSQSMQKKLLRVLQEGVIRRVGGKDYISVDVRTISATNKELLEEVRAGNFREDLYYRLNVINLTLPPLRERKEDIPELVETFLAGLASETGLEKMIEPAAMQYLIQHSWPGNIRELLNEIKRLHTLSDGDIRVGDLSETVLVGETRGLPFQEIERELSHLSLKEATERLEKEMIRNAFVQCRGNKSLMAKMLQVPKTSLYNKINKYPRRSRVGSSPQAICRRSSGRRPRRRCFPQSCSSRAAQMHGRCSRHPHRYCPRCCWRSRSSSTSGRICVFFTPGQGRPRDRRAC
jgi:two-component system NtrC family response regulator